MIKLFIFIINSTMVIIVQAPKDYAKHHLKYQDNNRIPALKETVMGFEEATFELSMAMALVMSSDNNSDFCGDVLHT